MQNNPQLLNNIQIILCNTSHTGNIGSAARAMKTMGLYNLTLVAPLVMPDDHSVALSCNASDVVLQAKIVTTLDEAIADSNLIIAMTGRKREFNTRLQTPKQIIPEILSTINRDAKVSIVFGNEQSGLTIPQLEKCNRLVTINGNPEYFSLNLSQAVQIMAYEIYSNFNTNLEHLKNEVNLASKHDVQIILDRLDNMLTERNFYDYKNHTRTIRRLQSILIKADLTREDVDLLHGVLRALQK